MRNHRYARPQQHRQRHSLQGFTLIELLVVVAIISLLVSILLPSLTKAKDLAKQVTCATNLKQIGLAALIYFHDNEDYMSTIARGSGSDTNYHYWTNNLHNGGYLPVVDWYYEPYGNTKKGVYRCPSVTDDGIQWGGGYGAHCLWGDHSIHLGPSLYKSTQYKNTKITEVMRPSEILMFADAACGPSSINAGKTSLFVCCPLCCGWALPDASVFSDRHNEGGNVCFIDGHVERRPYDELQANQGDIFGHLTP